MDERERTFLACYESTADSLLRHAYYKVSDREVAKDIVQESFMRTWDHLAKGKSIENMKAFVFHIANNLVIDYYRKKKTLSLDALAEDGFEPHHEDDAIIVSVETEQVFKMVEKLEEPYREVIKLRYVSGLSLPEIAAVVQESENAVSVRIHRAIKKLEEKLHL